MSVKYNVAVSDEILHDAEVASSVDLWENSGFLVRGVAEDGTDITLWIAAYFVRRGDGAEEESFHADSLAVGQILLVDFRGDQDAFHSMHDTDFVETGWMQYDYLSLGDVRVTAETDRVEWTVGGVNIVASPPHWKVKGSAPEVAVDLEFTAYVEAFDVDSFAKLSESGVAWYEAYLRANGTITHKDKVYAMRDVFACHERVASAGHHDLSAHLQAPGNRWTHLFDDRVQCWTYITAVDGSEDSWVAVDGEVVRAKGPAKVSIRDTDYWVDPKSWFRIPVAWVQRVETEAGVLELDVRAFARAYYPWSGFKDTVNVLYWKSCRASGTFTKTSGEVIEISDALFLYHSNRAFFHRGAVARRNR